MAVLWYHYLVSSWCRPFTFPHDFTSTQPYKLNGSKYYNETSTEWFDSLLRNEKMIKKILNKENTTRTWPRIRQTARLLLIPLRNPAGWYSWSLGIPIGILSIFTFLFYLIQYAILWVWISTTRDKPRVSRSSYTHSLRFPYILFSFSSLTWHRVGNKDATGRTGPCQRTLIKKEKERKKKKTDHTTLFTISFDSFNFWLTFFFFSPARTRHYDHTNADNIFDLWPSQFQQFNMIRDAWTYTCLLDLFDVTWWDMKMETNWLIYMNEVWSDVAT